MIKLLLFLALACALGYCGATVKLGNKTFFGHIQAIWKTEEVQDLKTGIEDKAAPVTHKIKTGVEEGYRAATTDDAGIDARAATP